MRTIRRKRYWTSLKPNLGPGARAWGTDRRIRRRPESGGAAADAEAAQEILPGTMKESVPIRIPLPEGSSHHSPLG